MKFFVGVTDNNWYNYLANSRPDEVNFWQPGGRQSFKAIEPNDLFLFKLHSPLNYISGGGFFVRYVSLPVSLAWETSPFFFNQSEWIPVPEDWSPNIVQGKTYDAGTLAGRRLYQQVQERLSRCVPTDNASCIMREDAAANRYGSGQYVYPRIG